MAAVETYPSEVRAQAKYLRTAPRKAQLVADQIRGRTVPEARTILAFTTRDAARDMEKVLNSAVANAEANHGLVGDELIVSAAFVGEGPTLKRWRARARGRAARIRKRTCHITLTLARPDGSVLPAPRGQAPAPAETPVTPRRSKAETAETEDTAETKPKRAAKPKADEEPKTTAEPKADAEEKPKRKRAAKPKAAADDKPKPKTTRKKKES
jgi:large subunit ribosomal protein L22